MTNLTKTREEFIEATCPTGSSQEQIDDMSMAFDAGAIVVLQMIMGFSDEEFTDKMNELAEEVMMNAQFHGE